MTGGQAVPDGEGGPEGDLPREQVLGEVARTDAPEDAKELFLEVALADELVDFLTLPAYDRLPE